MILQNNDVILKNNDITKMIKHRINKTEEVVENFDKSIEDMKNLLLRLPTDETSRNILITSQKSESVTAKLKTELTELKSEYAKLESVMAQLESENAKLIETSNFMNDIKERARKKKEK